MAASRAWSTEYHWLDGVGLAAGRAASTASAPAGSGRRVSAAQISVDDAPAPARRGRPTRWRFVHGNPAPRTVKAQVSPWRDDLDPQVQRALALPQVHQKQLPW